jgi:hypothetical protein
MDGSDQWHTIYKTKLVIPSTQTDVLPQHKLFLCGYAVLNRTVWYIINCALDWNWIIYFTHDLQNILYTIQWSSIYDWLFATVMHVPRIVCVCFSTVNVGKCKQQVTELLLHMITIKFWKWVWIDKWQFTK